MSLFKAALTGFSAAGANVANKYLDDQIAKDRAQFLADLQRKTSGQIREDDYAFKTDPGRVQTTRDIAAGDVKAQAGAKRAAEMEGWTDTDYQAARDAQTKKETDEEARKKTLFAQAEAKYRARTPGSDDPFSKLPPAVRASYQGLAKQAEQINAAIVKAQADGMWEPDKNKAQSDLLIRQRVLEDKAQELLQPYIPKQGKGGASPDDDIRALLTGGAAGPTAAGAAPAGAPKPPPGPLAAMDDRTLQRLATIEGHANQAKAIEELQRRGKWQDKPKQAGGGQTFDYSSVAPT